MAPRRQAQRTSRMHAAIDHMGKMGFKAKLVEKTAKSLLKEYGIGADGWVFIEEISYKVLLDRILLDQEGEEKKKKETESSKEEEADGIASLEASSEAGPSCLPGAEDAANETTENGLNGMVTSSTSSDPPSPPPAAADPLDIGGVGGQDVATERTENGLNGMVMSSTSTDAPPPPPAAADPMDIGGVGGQEAFTFSSPASSSSVPRARRTRFPCYGWISDDDDDDDDEKKKKENEFVPLLPAFDLKSEAASKI